MQYPTIAQPQYAFAPTMMAEGGLVDVARSVQSRGRGEDTMLVHMTPREVGGLQALAMSQGGSLTINPETGLPEAGFLKNLLPTLLSVGLTMAGVDPVTAGMIVGGGTTVATGDLGQGIMAGLGAYGGASASQAMGLGGSATPTPTPPTPTPTKGLPTVIAPSGDISLATSYTGPGATEIVSGGAPMNVSGYTGTGLGGAKVGVPTAQTQPTFMQRFSQAAAGPGGTPSMFKTGLAGFGAIAPFAPQPKYEAPKEEESDYEGPYTPTKRTVSYPGEEQRRRTSEYMYFNPSNPLPFAEGGDVAAPSMSAPEAQVFSQIANVQRLAGLPVIDTSRFTVRSLVPPVEERMGLVYNPIDNTYTSPIGSSGTPLGSAGGAERSYGFESLSSDIPQGGVPTQSIAPQSAIFYKPTNLGRRIFRVDPVTQPDEYRELYEQYVPTRNVNMSLYEYDPYLGGYKERPIPYSDNAKGGLIRQVSAPQLESGGFVLTKKAVDGLGDGDNERGQKVASRGLGAIPIKGPGTGTSDSIKTTIDGKQPARIANGESYVPKRQVAKRGGAKAFYALMNKAEKAANRRKRA